jgi:hypothetical protein
MNFILFLLYILPLLSIKLSVIKTGLITLPRNIHLFKYHQLVLLEDKNEKVVVDFVPLSLNKKDIIQLIIGKNIPATIRMRKIPSYISDTNIVSFLCSQENNICDCSVKSLSLKIFLYRISNWYDLKKNNYTLNLYKRNCQHYRQFVETNYLIYLGRYLSK